MPKILLVEDDASLLELYKTILTDAGYMVDTAIDGIQAEKKMKDGGYDIVLLDLLLPGKNGIQILEDYQKNLPVNPNKKIVILTSMNMDEFIKSALSMGADGYLMKATLTPDQVVAEVGKFLST
jgi:DNA-binding response OmpR family regulator